MSSAGLGVFLATQKRLKSIGKELYLCDVADPIRNVFSISGLDSFFAFIESGFNHSWWIAFPVI